MQNNPWSDIPAAPSARLSRLRVDTESGFGLYWIRDEKGNPGLLAEIDSRSTTSQLNSFGLNLRNVQVDMRDFSELGSKALLIRLTDHDKAEIFYRLCTDIVTRTASITDRSLILSAVCSRLKQWQSLFAGQTNGLLTTNEIQGLFAELALLKEILDARVLPEDVVVRGWQGPYRSQQDFILNDVAIEVKSVTGQNRGSVRISSEDQLYTHLNTLLLRVCFMAETPDGQNLNSLVHSVRNIIVRDDVREVLMDALAAVGYFDLPNYDEPRFVVNERRTYSVTDGFPRITRATLPSGLQTVTYDLLLAHIEYFRVSDSPFAERA